MSTISLNSSGMNMTRLLGPALAGILIEMAGIDAVYYITVGCYVAVVGTLLMIPATGVVARRWASVGQDLREGIGYIGRSPVILSLLIMAFVPLFLGMAYRNLLPAFVVDVLGMGASLLGLLMAAIGTGALVGSLGTDSLGDYPRKGRLLVASALFFGLALVLFSLSRSYGLALFFLLGVGIGNTSFMTMNNTLVQLHTGDEMRGRVMSIYQMTFGIQTLGALPIGALAAGGVLLVLFTLGMVAGYPRLARL